MRAAVLAVLVATVAALAVSAPAVLGRASWDDARYQRELVPARRAAASAVQRGELPLWWDGAGFGAPLASLPRSAPLYPASWVSSDGWGGDLFGALHLALLGAAASWLAAAAWRRRTGAELARSARALAAVAPAASGLGSAALVGGWVASLAWLLMALAIAVEWRAGTNGAEGKKKRAQLAAAVAAVGVGGAPELLLVAVAAIAIAAMLVRGTARRARRGGEGAARGEEMVPAREMMTAVIVGAMASAAQWLPWLRMGAPGLDARALLSTVAMLGLVVAALGVARLVAARSQQELVGAPESEPGSGTESATGTESGSASETATESRSGSASGAGSQSAMGSGSATGAGSERRPEGESATASSSVSPSPAAPASPLVVSLVSILSLLALAALAITAARTPWRARASLDELPSWLAAPLPPALAAMRDAGAPVRVFCPPRTKARDLAAGEPGEPLLTAPAALRCAQGRSAVEAALWQRGAGAGGRLLRRLSIPLAIVPSSTVNAVGFQQLGAQGSWALVALAARPLAAVYPATLAAADPPAALAAVVPAPGRPGAAAAQLVVEGSAALGAAPRPRVPPPDEEHQGHEHDPLAHEPIEITAPLLEGAPPEPCSLRTWRPGEISLRCPSLPAPGVAAVASAWSPGWQVTVDGAAARPLRVEAILRGVALPARAPGAATSSHVIVWRYRPAAWPLAAALSALGLAGLAGLLALAWRARFASATSLRAIVQRHR